MSATVFLLFKDCPTALNPYLVLLVRAKSVTKQVIGPGTEVTATLLLMDVMCLLNCLLNV